MSAALEPEVAARLFERGENLRLSLVHLLKLWRWDFERLRPHLISGELTATGIRQPDGSWSDVCIMSNDALAFMRRHGLPAETKDA